MNRLMFTGYTDSTGALRLLPYNEEPLFKIKSKLSFILYTPVNGNVRAIIPFFHGLGKVGGDLIRVEGEGLPKNIAKGEEHECAIIAFHLHEPKTEWYVRILNDALAIIDHYKKLYEVPVIPTGLSLGGIALPSLCNIAYDKFGPKYFKGVAIVCGKANVKDYTPLLGMSVCWWHGVKDSNSMPISNARAFYKKLTEAGGTTTLIEYPDMGHNIWDKVYNPSTENGFWDFVKPLLEEVPKEEPKPEPKIESMLLFHVNGKVYAYINGEYRETNISVSGNSTQL